MGKFKRVIVLEVEIANDKNQETPGGKYRRDTPWLVEAFKKKGVESEILFITNKDSAQSLKERFSDTAFLGRVNPMDYSTLSLDEYVKILKDLKKDGLLLGPEADHMDRLGSKMILYELRDTGMGVDGVLLHHFDDLKKNQGEIDRILPAGGPPRVLKMMRGSTGLGVWKLDNKGDKILMTDAYTHKTEEIGRQEVIPKFLALCQEDAISMPFLPLIKDGEFRFLLSKHQILEVVHKRPVDESAFYAFNATLRSGAVYTMLDLTEHKSMVDTVVNWSNDLKKALHLDDVPYWWSVDCIEEEVKGGFKPGQIPSSNPGRHLVLSEINCSCLGLVVGTSAEAKLRGLKFADMIANMVLA